MIKNHGFFNLYSMNYLIDAFKPKPIMIKNIPRCFNNLKHSGYFNLSYLEQRVPASRTQCHTITAHSETTDTIIMGCQNTNTFAFECIPNIAVEVIIPSKQ